MTAARRPATMRLAALACLLLCVACAPRLQPVGPMTGTARITNDAFITRDGARLPLRAWKPDGAPRVLAVALHGFNDYSSAFEVPAAAWARDGVLTYAIDQRGFGAAPHRGKWPGTAAMVGDLRALTGAARRRHPGVPVYLVGESMGAAVVMAALANGGVHGAKGAVLVAPAVWGRRHLGAVTRGTLWLSAHTVPWLELTAEGLEIQPSDNFEMLKRFSRDPLVIKSTRVDAILGLVGLMDTAYAGASRISLPVLTLYGIRDEVIPSDPTMEVIAALARAGPGTSRAALYERGWHMLLRDLDGAVAINDIAAWMRNPTAPLPSGAEIANQGVMTPAAARH